MRTISLILAIAFLILGAVVLVFAEGARRWYSGLFFVALGLAVLGNPVSRKGEKAEG